MALAQIHRFRDKVAIAIFLANGATVYLTPKEAKAIAKALNAGARDIQNNTFVQSDFSTVIIESENKD